MPETVRIDLSPVIDAMNVVNRNVIDAQHQLQVVGNMVEVVAQEQVDTKQRLEKLYIEFQDYVDKDLWANEVSTARQELTLLRQELETKFGHYAEVRRHTTGILQAVDVAIVREEKIRSAAEGLMLSCPRYWLAPGLIALSAWISDKKPLAEKAVGEAIRRDDSKTSLFFGLVCRRARRAEALAIWLTRYFQLQNPYAMDREVVIMLDALANGVFGGAALTACSTVIDQWLEELEQQAGFPDEQRKRWAEALDVMTPKLAMNEFPTLRKSSPTWPQLEVSLAAARRNQVIKSFFEQLFTGEIVVPPYLETAVDDLLVSLVTNFDDEELPLRRKERLNEIVVEVDKLPILPREKRQTAKDRFAAETDSMKEQTDFAGMLTNAALYPERTKATVATRRYAVSRSRPWVIAGFNDLTARDRARVPAEAELACGSWKGTSRDGSNEQSLSSDLFQHYARRIEEAINAVGITGGTWAVTIIGGLLGLLFLFNKDAWWFGLLILAGAGGYFFYQYKNLDNIRQRKREELEKERDDAGRILKAGLAELTDLRREAAKEDRKADEVVELLTALSSPQFVLKRPDQARAVVA